MTPPFPKTVEELAPWQVYADQLIERGDERGAYISRELSLTDHPSADELSAFRDEAHSLCKSPPFYEVGWALGHIRTLTLGTAGPNALLSEPTGPKALQVLVDLAAYLKSPLAAQLESLQLPVTASLVGREWDELMQALPRSCTRLALTVIKSNEGFGKRVLESLPPQVRHLGYSHPTSVKLEDVAWFVDDRIDELSFRGFYDRNVPENLAQRLAKHPHVRLRLGTVGHKTILPLLGNRAIVGRTGDALVIGQNTHMIVVMERKELRLVQRANGIVPIRAQLSRSLPEQHSQFTRSRIGDWFVRSLPTSSVKLDFQEVGPQPVPVRPGARVEYGNLEYRFHEITDEESTQRELLAEL